ncbi:alpha-1-antitrypsin-like [Pyxicephalus adspersus]|uniref:alpha-1-antitrypsin-like n=1 Tax=Pyxicephalus adspersus TaxID=30357 RepID=UPI003B58BB4C
MRILLYLGLSLALFCSLAFADHHKGQGRRDGNKDDHESKDDPQQPRGGHHRHHGHLHGHQRGHHHGHHHGHHRHHHHHGNETLACHKLADSNSNFAFDLFRQVAADHSSENIVLSPVSISTALALLSLGAEGKTQAQIIEGIGFNTSEISKKEIHDGFQHLLEVLNDDDDSELHVDSGNGLFISHGWKILDDFLQKAKDLYDSEAVTVDFQNNEEVKNQINSYVAQKTDGKITDALSTVDKEAALVLVNFIYFRANWKNPFDENLTKEGDFHVNKDETVKVPFLSRTGFYKTAILDDATLVAVPYEGNASALFVLPNEGKLKEVESNLKYLVKKWKRSSHSSFVDLSIPKFSVSGSFDLKQVLPKFGIVDLFSDGADLSGITGAPNLKISQALHKAKINVNERGTEAAGATIAEGVPMMIPIEITFNHPFIFTVYNQETRSVLFMGRVSNPAI